jgi:hypothetical protein
VLNLQKSIELHSRRNISVLGRATIINSLILSKCWYTLTVVPVPLAVLREIISIVSNFVTAGIFPKISWSLMITSKKKGGLGVLDPLIQQKALYHRWVDPILFPDCDGLSLISSFVAAHFLNYTHLDNLSPALLFPKSRNISGLAVSVASLIARTMDSIPRDFGNLVPNPIECLLFPLKAIIASTNGYRLSPKLLSLTVSSLFEYHPIGHFLRVKTTSDIDAELRIVAKRFFKAVFNGKCTLHTFFHNCLFVAALNFLQPTGQALVQPLLNFHSFKQGLLIKAFDPDDLASRSPAKTFRTAIAAHSSEIVLQNHIRSADWSRFWSLSLVFTQRNVLYRFIFDKIPTRLLLSSLVHNRFPTSDCCLCSAPETKYHFFFACPLKSTFWDLLIREFLWPGTTIDQICSCIQHLHFSSLSLLPGSPAKAPVLLIVALSEL